MHKRRAHYNGEDVSQRVGTLTLQLGPGKIKHLNPVDGKVIVPAKMTPKVYVCL